MKRAIINPDLCLNCSPCPVEESCSMQAAFRESPGDKPWIDFYRCSGCLDCKRLCPHGAIEEVAHPCEGKGRIGW
ncbi:MAG: ATP-binding protein [Armatimonadota bacterium]